ncbi:triokinase/FMN cyclase-like isoform X2 [Lingula anatina]|uniref:Triokinase/FMN cyclase n=1 Tax=Lingula anatina TaxID=7574 RepID=A0A2R2MMP3_LINAN|nr:triokinase/FMN cyclase-like isoform X2 [Lingula anatina]|eukprot:XP_023931486.1 triokinase/FMN cyclase-like isoform X2 [Lingula anatina]
MSQAKGKKLINTVERCVDDSLEGFVAVNPGARLLQGHRVVVRSDIEEYKASGKVAVISGGGSGHEPAHPGYVGRGMLSAAVCGAVFASPPPNSILAGIRAVGKGNKGGVLLCVANYTGDRLTFGIAFERAKRENINIKMVVVGEDCALTSADKSAGRRGMCGFIVTWKLAGALAEEGRPLEEIVSICTEATQNMGTIGIALSPCSLPGQGPTFQLGEDEMELGLGVHGEAGVKRMKMLTAKETVEAMIALMTNKNSSTHLDINKGDKVAVLVNNLGGTSVLELTLMAGEVIRCLENKGVLVQRAFCGSFMTSLEMAGVIVTVMHLNDVRAKCLDAATSAPGWSPPFLAPGMTNRETPERMPADDADLSDMIVTSGEGLTVDADTGKLLYSILKAICETLISQESSLNQLDSQTGDGDCGSTLKAGAEGILKYLGTETSPGLPVTHPQNLLLSLACLVERWMGGSSGAMYSLFVTAAAAVVAHDVSATGWCSAFQKGMQAISKYGGAEPGDRTMLDSMNAAYNTLVANLSSSSPIDAFETAVKAAEQAAADTANMTARAGRASYVSKDLQTQPDAGAVAVSVWLKAIYLTLKKS